MKCFRSDHIKIYNYGLRKWNLPGSTLISLYQLITLLRFCGCFLIKQVCESQETSSAVSFHYGSWHHCWFSVCIGFGGATCYSNLLLFMELINFVWKKKEIIIFSTLWIWIWCSTNLKGMDGSVFCLQMWRPLNFIIVTAKVFLWSWSKFTMDSYQWIVISIKYYWYI